MQCLSEVIDTQYCLIFQHLFIRPIIGGLGQHSTVRNHNNITDNGYGTREFVTVIKSVKLNIVSLLQNVIIKDRWRMFNLFLGNNIKFALDV